MKISTKGRYGLRIMMDIARHGQDGLVSLADLARRQGLSLKYTEQIARALVRGNLLKGVRGAQGGYSLVRAVETYTVGEILRSTEGELAPVSCVSGEFCAQSGDCVTYRLWEGLYALTEAYLDAVTLKDMLDPAFSPRTIWEHLEMPPEIT